MGRWKTSSRWSLRLVPAPDLLTRQYHGLLGEALLFFSLPASEPTPGRQPGNSRADAEGAGPPLQQQGAHLEPPDGWESQQAVPTQCGGATALAHPPQPKLGTLSAITLQGVTKKQQNQTKTPSIHPQVLPVRHPGKCLTGAYGHGAKQRGSSSAGRCSRSQLPACPCPSKRPESEISLSRSSKHQKAEKIKKKQTRSFNY